MAIIDKNTLKIVEAGALPLYVKLLNKEGDESVQAAAAKGIWHLAFKCKERINEEPGCVEGGCNFSLF